MELARRIVSAIISLSFTMILANNSMIIVIVILFILSIIGIAINIKLYKLILVGKKIKSEESNNRNFEQIKLNISVKKFRKIIR